MTTNHPTLLARLADGHLVSATLALTLAAAELATKQDPRAAAALASPLPNTASTDAR